MRINFTLDAFPVTSALKDRTGLPFSAVLQPFAKAEDAAAASGLEAVGLGSSSSGSQSNLRNFASHLSATQGFQADIARCSSCYSFISCYSETSVGGWNCSICNKRNEFKHVTGRRYNAVPSARSLLPELQGSVFEVLVEEPTPVGQQEGHSVPGQAAGPAPVYLALVDLSGSEEYVELVRSSLLAALEALPADALFGLVTFSDKLGLHDVKAVHPTVRYVSRFGTQPLLVGLEEAMPLRALLAPVGLYKDAIAASVETLTPAVAEELLHMLPLSTTATSTAASPAPTTNQSANAATAAANTSGYSAATGAGLVGRAFGSALLGVLEYLKGLQHPPFAGPLLGGVGNGQGPVPDNLQPATACPIKLLAFLAGPPNLGAGSLIRRRRPRLLPPPPPPARPAPAPPAPAQPPLSLFSNASQSGSPRMRGPPGPSPLSSNSPQPSPFITAAPLINGGGDVTVYDSSAAAPHPPASGLRSGSGLLQPQAAAAVAAAIATSNSGSLGNGATGSPKNASNTRGGEEFAGTGFGSRDLGHERGGTAHPQTTAQHAQQPHLEQQQQQHRMGSGEDSDAATTVEVGEDEWIKSVTPTMRQFYEQAAVVAASLGVCIDLFAVGPGALGLAALEPLCNSTGGGMWLYVSVDEAAMPQDMYRRLSSPSAGAGILRIRTSVEFKVSRYYGRLFADPQIDNLHHIISCDPHDAFAVDFDYTTATGFSKPGALPPTLQVAFQYTTLVPVPRPATAASANGGASTAAAAQPLPPLRYTLQRRLRVGTFRPALAQSAPEVYAGAQADAIVALLMHKITRVALAEGKVEARLILRDWLVVLAIHAHRNLHPEASHAQLADMQVDLAFPGAPSLTSLPRLVYALLRSPCLAPPADGQHPDLTPFLEHLWCCLPPGELVRAIYPVLASFSDPNTRAYPRHSLSRAALLTVDAPIFLLDAYITILVYYTAAAPKSMPFPPPQNSLLRKAVAAIRQERRIMPAVKVLREGSEDAWLFNALLLDEPESHGTDNAGPAFGLVQFLDHIRSEAGEALRVEAKAAAAATGAAAGGGR